MAQITQVNLPKRNFLRRTKATSPPDTTEPETATDNTETTTSKFPKRGGSKFNPRKELPEKKESAEKNQFENRTRQPSLSGARRSERPTRKFVRKRPGGANVTGVSSTLAPSASTVSAAARRPGLFNRRKPVPTIYTTTTTTTPLPTTALPTTTAASQGTTVAFEDEESLQDIGDTDAIEDPSLEPRGPKPTIKTQRRPLVSLKDPVNDQNPSATNEEERTRQSKKFSATINQNQLEDLIKLKSSSQEETTTERRTTADDITAETALAIAAHQLITAPIPSVEELSDDGTPKRTQTTGGYQYTNRQYNDFTDSKTPAYDEYQSTPIYRSTIGQSYDTTAYRIPTEYDSPKITTVDFDVPKTTTRFETTPIYKIDYQTTSGDSYSTDFDRPKISTTTYNIPKSYSDFSTNQDYIRTTTGKDYGFSTDFYSPNTYLPKSPTTYPNTNNFRSTLDDTYSEIPPEYNTRIPTEYNTKIPTEYNTRIPTEYNTRIPTEYNSRIPEYNSRIPTAFTARSPSTNYLRTTGNTYPETDAATEFTSRTYVPRYSTTQEEYQTTLSVETTETSPRISTTLVPKSTQGRFVERTTAGYSDTPTDIDSAKITTDFVPRSTVSRGRSRYDGKDLKNELETPNVIPAGISVNRGSQRARGEKIPIPVESGYSTVGYSSASQDPAQFTREYLLESPVTKTYDDEYQYLSPTSTTPTTPITKPTRKVFRKKIQRKISTTQRPTTRLPLVTEPATSPTPIATTPKSRRVPSKKPFEKVPKAESGRTYRPIDNYDYYDDPQERVVGRYAEGTKVILHGQGHIECLDIGNFPHPTSCKKFISCARMERGALLGWEYVCPKGLSFDPVGGICNWSAGLGCEEKDS